LKGFTNKLQIDAHNNLGALEEHVVYRCLIRQVNEKKNIVVYLRFDVDEGNLEFERVHKQAPNRCTQ
jgi:hypothetical protein